MLERVSIAEQTRRGALVISGYSTPIAARKQNSYVKVMVASVHETVHATACSQSYGRTLILDLGNVLFHSSSTFQSVILTPTWGKLECG